MHVSRYNVSETASIMKRLPVETFRNVGRENVSKLAVFPTKPRRKVNV